MKLVFSKQFQKSYNKLSPKLKKQVAERLRLFAQSPWNTQLRNHKLTGEFRSYRSINISGDYRALYEEVGEDVALLMKLGTHSELYKK